MIKQLVSAVFTDLSPLKDCRTVSFNFLGVIYDNNS